MAEQTGRPTDTDRSEGSGHSSPRPRRRRLFVVLGLALAALVALVGIVALVDGPPEAPLTRGEGRPAPGFSLPDLRRPEEKVELASYRGRPVVLNFWASWCVPCRREMPTFQAVSQELGHRVAFVGINHQDGRSPALRLLEETGVTYPAGHDPEGKVAVAYGLIGMPTTVFISPTGQVVATQVGEMSRSQLATAIEELFDS